MSEEEYEVESIREARVEAASRSKKAKLVWKYLVGWKGYTADDDTWEPIDSFVGSENMVQTFWERAQTNGRDWKDLSQFRAGETFRPVGPPRRPKRKLVDDIPAELPPERSQEEGPPTTESSTKPSEKRQRIYSEVDESSDRPPKRTREVGPHTQNSASPNQKTISDNRRSPRKINTVTAAPISSKQEKKAPSPEIIPDSDEEMNPPTPIRVTTYLSRSKSSSSRIRNKSSPIMLADNATVVEIPDIEPLVDEQPASSKVPAHRARKENPLVKTVNFSDPGVMVGAISTKAHAVDRANAIASSSKEVTTAKRARPGPGRSSAGLIPPKNTSSLLTFEKGSLKTIKGKYTKQDTNDSTAQESSAPGDIMDTGGTTELGSLVPQDPPSAEELLKLAGLDVQAAESLPDFDDDPTESDQKQADPHSIVTDQTPPSNEAKPATALKESLAHAADILFHGNVPMSSAITASASFTRSTIFGPLTMASESNARVDQSQQSRLLLNLDTSVSIPVLLTVATSLDCFNSKIGSKGTPGKFYHTEAALTLLGTVRAEGASAVVVIDEEATAEEKDHFARFSARLEAGDLFVAVTGTRIFVFFSTSSILLSHRLNVAPSLVNQPAKILVSQVDVENYSGYADATAQADERRWTHSIAAN